MPGPVEHLPVRGNPSDSPLIDFLDRDALAAVLDADGLRWYFATSTSSFTPSSAEKSFMLAMGIFDMVGQRCSRYHGC